MRRRVEKAVLARVDKFLGTQRGVLDVGVALECAAGRPARVGAAMERGERIARRLSQVLYEPPTPLSVAGVENQAVDRDQIIAIITDLCVDGFTLHSPGARTLWFAIETAENIGCPYVVYRENDRGQVLNYLLVRTDLPTPALPARFLGVVREVVSVVAAR